MNQLSETPKTEVVLAWKIHLLKRRPDRAVPLFAIFGCAGISVWLMFHNLIPALVSILLLVSATSDFLFPTTNRIDDSGVFSHGTFSRNELSWSNIRRVTYHPYSVSLSPLETPSRLDAFRGVTLIFAPAGEAGDEATVMDAIRLRFRRTAPKAEMKDETDGLG